MIKMTDGKIGMREFAAIVTIMIAVKGKDTTPDLLIFPGMNAAWMIPVISYIIILPMFLLMYYLIKKYGVDLFQLLTCLTGKIGASIIGSVLCVSIFSYIVINSRSYTDIINTMYYDQTELIILYMILLFGSFSLAYQGIAAVGGATRIFIAIWIALSILLVFLVWKDVNWLHLFPLFGPGSIPLLRGGVSFTSIYLEVIVLALLYSMVRNDRSYFRGSFIGLAVSVAWIVLMMILYTLVFDFPAMEFINFLYHQLAQVAALFGGTNAHLDAIFMGFWIVASLLHFAVYLFLAAFLFAKVFNIRDEKPLLLPFTGLALLLGMLPDNITSLNTYRMTAIQTNSFIAVLLPIVLWLLHIWKGWKGRPQHETSS